MGGFEVKLHEIHDVPYANLASIMERPLAETSKNLFRLTQGMV
jgi:hypothetical protein